MLFQSHRDKDENDGDDARRKRSRLCSPADSAVEREAAGKSYRNFWLHRWALGRLNNKDLCISSWFHTRSGGLGVADFAAKPNLKAENYSRRVRKALGLDLAMPFDYHFKLPLWDVGTASRVMGWILVRLPHEVLARDAKRRPELYSVRGKDRDSYRVDSFVKHPVTMANGIANTAPIGYYLDKVALGKYENFYRASCNSLLSRKRITLWVIRGSLICKCGCNGNCTIDAIQVVMNASFNLLQKKMYMASRFDTLPWQPTDSMRKARASEPLEIRGAVCEIRADLPERCRLAGVKTHRGGCMVCTAKPSQMHNRYHECSLHRLPSGWEFRDQAKYLTELMAQLHSCTITTLPDRESLLKSLRWRVKYPWGRAFFGVSKFNLRAGDRLVSGGDLGIDLYELDSLPLPFTVYFLRQQQSSCITSVSLMWNVPGVHNLGIDHLVITYIADCTLHTLDLGVAQRYCGHAIRCALRNNVHNIERDSLKDRMAIGAMRVRRDLKAYYKKVDEVAVRLGERRVNRIKCFTLKKLGPNLDTPVLLGKGAQSRALVRFCADLLHEHCEKVGTEGKYLVSAGRALQEYYEILKNEARLMPLNSKLRLMHLCLHHNQLYGLAGGHYVHKHHIFVHLTAQVCFSGNPAATSTYEDESENGVIAGIGAVAHPLTWTRSVFERLEVLDNLALNDLNDVGR